MLDRAARLTPGGLRAAIARAVMEAAPEKARERRETAARFARVERWAEDSGNAALMGRELPPDEVLAADQRITAWAGELRKAGLDGGMDELRARAYLDLLLGKDSRPQAVGSQAGTPGQAPGRPGRAGRRRGSGRVRRAGQSDRPAGHPDRPGRTGPASCPGSAPSTPGWPATWPPPPRTTPRRTWCVTVTDQHGHAIGHGCARPEPKSHRKRAGPGPPGRAGFSFTPASRDGPPGGYGTWRLRTPGPGPGPDHHARPAHHRPCDHRFESQRPRPRGQAPAPVPDPARHLHQPHLPPARQPVRLRAQHPVRGGRENLSL